MLRKAVRKDVATQGMQSSVSFLCYRWYVVLLCVGNSQSPSREENIPLVQPGTPFEDAPLASTLTLRTYVRTHLGPGAWAFQRLGLSPRPAWAFLGPCPLWPPPSAPCPLRLPCHLPSTCPAHCSAATSRTKNSVPAQKSSAHAIQCPRLIRRRTWRTAAARGPAATSGMRPKRTSAAAAATAAAAAAAAAAATLTLTKLKTSWLTTTQL